MPQWLLYELVDSAAICQITFLPRMDNSAGNVPRDCPSSFRFEGSHDGTAFETILSVENQDPCVAEAILTKSFANDEAFRFYRFTVLDVPGRAANLRTLAQQQNAKYVIIRDLRFFGNNDSIPCSSSNIATGTTCIT